MPGDKCSSHMLSRWVQLFMDRNQGLPFQKDSFFHILSTSVDDIKAFSEMIVKKLSKIEFQLVQNFERVNVSTVTWKTNPIPNIMDKLWGCREFCPFCHAPCINTNKEHVKQDKKSHVCLQHRPEGIGGQRWHDTRKMSVDFL